VDSKFPLGEMRISSWEGQQIKERDTQVFNTATVHRDGAL